MKRESILMFQVDAFADKPFNGNPAAVCILRRRLQDSVRQSIAAEMNLSETAFLEILDKKPITQNQEFGLRWFTPKVEVPLCGHATLATAAVLFDEFGVRGKTIKFHTRSGVLLARKEKQGIVLDFPANPPRPCKVPALLMQAIGIKRAKKVMYSPGMRMLLIHLGDAAAVRRLRPDFGRMRSATVPKGVLGVIVTAAGSRGVDFVSRFFGPWVGVNEDPVTGSAHTVLGPYWSGLFKKKTMTAFQCSARGGKLAVRVKTNSRVELVGKAVTVLHGILSV